jgi:hypothetical protein
VTVTLRTLLDAAESSDLLADHTHETHVRFDRYCRRCVAEETLVKVGQERARRSGDRAPMTKEPMAPEKCPHDDTRVDASLAHITDTGGKPAGLHYLDVSATCDACGQRYQFIGFEAGLSPREPRVNVGAESIRLPCRLRSDPPQIATPGFDVRRIV